MKRGYICEARLYLSSEVIFVKRGYICEVIFVKRLYLSSEVIFVKRGYICQARLYL